MNRTWTTSSHKFDEQDSLVLPIVEEIAGVVHCKPQVGLTPHDRVQQRTVEQHTDIPVPRVFKECIEVVRLVPQERMQRRTAGCMVDVPFLQDGDAGDTGETVRMGAWSEESYKPATQALGPRLRRMQSLAVQAWALPKGALGEISWKWCMSFLRHGSSGVSWSTLSTFPCRADRGVNWRGGPFHSPREHHEGYRRTECRRAKRIFQEHFQVEVP